MVYLHVGSSQNMVKDRKLTDKERKEVAKVIDNVVVNNRYPSEDDLCSFTLLMFELYQKKFNLVDLDINSFGEFCAKNFSDSAKCHMQDRIDIVSELVWAMWEKNKYNKRDYLSSTF